MTATDARPSASRTPPERPNAPAPTARDSAPFSRRTEAERAGTRSGRARSQSGDWRAARDASETALSARSERLGRNHAQVWEGRKTRHGTRTQTDVCPKACRLPKTVNASVARPCDGRKAGLQARWLARRSRRNHGGRYSRRLYRGNACYRDAFRVSPAAFLQSNLQNLCL